MPVSNKPSELTPYWQSDCGRAVVYVGDMRKVLPLINSNYFHAVVTDPPYELVGVPQTNYSSMEDSANKRWAANWDSTGISFNPDTWGDIARTCKPGAHILAFGGSRLFHRMTCAIEDADIEIRDVLMWLYSSGYPKGLDISVGIDKELGATREVIGVKRMPDTRKVRPGFTGKAHSKHHSGSMRDVNITSPSTDQAKEWNGWNTTLKPAWEPIILARVKFNNSVVENVLNNGCGGINIKDCQVNGRWPANVLHDGEDELLCRYFYGSKSGSDPNNRPLNQSVMHPTVKPLDLMCYLVRLVCAKGGTVLDPFMGSGSTGCAAIAEGMYFVGIEQSKEYADIAVDRLKEMLGIHEKVERLKSGKRVVKDAPPPPRKLR